MDRYLLCEIDQVDIPQDYGGDAITRDVFEAFLRIRYKTMKDSVLKTLGYSAAE